MEIKTQMSDMMGADAPAGDSGAEEQSRAVAVLQLLAAVLEESPSNRQSFAQLSGAPLSMHFINEFAALWWAIRCLISCSSEPVQVHGAPTFVLAFRLSPTACI